MMFDDACFTEWVWFPEYSSWSVPGEDFVQYDQYGFDTVDILFEVSMPDGKRHTIDAGSLPNTYPSITNSEKSYLPHDRYLEWRSPYPFSVTVVNIYARGFSTIFGEVTAHLHGAKLNAQRNDTLTISFGDSDHIIKVEDTGDSSIKRPGQVGWRIER